ncbi:MAG: bifunctional (p)ppGpp synthetase/guanosine-3',5'-bis(diphosphate) 3'-pyrophosphohydrolase [Lachnospiraceae bacterium]|nr:bifunctional (p)ppGpp synthetase/guanosine-3',5'-bis(diphosphate) 3'-pyrophosphohydrolase [Lachnospiraceae bacterium]
MKGEVSMADKIFDNSRIFATQDYTSPEALYTSLIDRIHKYHPSDDVTMVAKAYQIADNAHKGQKRKSGEPYIIHPLSTGIILADLELDKETIEAGLLHDVVEDTIMTTEDLTREFGEDVSRLVDGVTKLSKLKYNGNKMEFQADNLRKMFLAMAKDIRVVIIKLADRLHNMRTLQYQPPAKQQEIARETLDIYSPIAQRLGISRIKVELDDLSLKVLKPDVYQDLKVSIAQRKGEREGFVAKIVEEVNEKLVEAGIKASVYGRVKHFFSIYKKMVNQHKTLDQIYDLFAVRIVVDSDMNSEKDADKDCYAVLGIIHDMYKPIPGRFKDYIAMPKANNYQSLHTTLIGPNGTPFEIQIRTSKMHRTAEFGIAAHWKYKEVSNGHHPDEGEEKKLAWLREILEYQRNLSDNKEFMDLIKSDLNLFSDYVYCFTPSGDVKNLPAGSTPVDFAYSIHSAVGNRMVGARVNGMLVNIDYQIQNGDRIEIITSQNSRGPSRDWLKIVRSTQARSKINQWFKNELKEDNILKGKEAIASYCKSKGIALSDIMKTAYQEAVLQKYGFRNFDAVYAAIGHGGLKEGQIVNKMVERLEADHRKEMTDEELLSGIEESAKKHIVSADNGGIMVEGVSDVAVHLSKCCSPLPGDEIVGFVTRGRGISIHRTDCANVMGMSDEDRARLIEVEWVSKEADKEEYVAEIHVFADNRNGLLMDISKILSDSNIGITSMNCRVNKQDIATISISFNIHNTTELDDILKKLRSVPNVKDIERS